MKKVLHGNLSCLADYGPPQTRADNFLRMGRPPIKSFIESLILFDQIVIPTNDYMPLSLLIGILGEKSVLDLLANDTLKFARFKSSIAYAGGGVGVSTIQLFDSDAKTPKYFSANTQDAISVAVGATVAKEKRAISKLAFQGTSEFTLEQKTGDFATSVYSEVGKNLSILSHPFHANLKRLPGVSDVDVRGLSGVWEPGQDDDVFQILRVAQACMESTAALATACDDIYTADQVSNLYRRDLSKLTRQLVIGGQYAELRELSDLPDIAETVLSDKSKLVDIIKLRNSSSGAAFRVWFHDNCVTDPTRTAKEYASLLRSIPTVQTFPAKTIRFIASAAVGVATLPIDPFIGLGAGIAVSGVDAFLVDRLFKGASPKIFIERLADIAKVD